MSRNTSPTSPATFRDLSASGQFSPVVALPAGPYINGDGLLVGDDGLPERLEWCELTVKAHPETTAVLSFPAADYCRTPPSKDYLLTGAAVPSAEDEDEEGSHLLRSLGYGLPLALLLWLFLAVCFSQVRGMVSPGAVAVSAAQVAKGGK